MDNGTITRVLDKGQRPVTMDNRTRPGRVDNEDRSRDVDNGTEKGQFRIALVRADDDADGGVPGQPPTTGSEGGHQPAQQQAGQ